MLHARAGLSWAVSTLLITSALVACGSAANPNNLTPAAGSEKVTLTIESWRLDDQKVWTEQIIPVFEKSHPNIQVEFEPSVPTEYNKALSERLQAGTAGDLITCRPFDASLGLFQAGHLLPINDLKGLENFSDVSKSAWQTDDGQNVFCLPMASVLHGFIYNKEAFAKLSVKEPTTEEEFFQVLEALKKDGTYTPLVLGTAEQWEAATMGFQNIGPNYWKGEEGRQALIKGTAKFTDQPYIQTFQQLARWKDYLPQGFETLKNADAQAFFMEGKGAIYPAGSWEISTFSQGAKFPLGAFKPVVARAGDQCYISDHNDIGMGINAKTKHPQEARQFLEWMATPEFANLFSNALPGFFSLSNHPITLKEPLTQNFVNWRKECKSTIRNSYQILSRGTPNLEDELWRTTVGVINGSMAPEQAGQELQQGLEQWYKPR